MPFALLTCCLAPALAAAWAPQPLVPRPAVAAALRAPAAARRLPQPPLPSARHWRALALALPPPLTTALGLNSALAALGTAAGQNLLTSAGLAHAWFLGVLLWSTLGPAGWGLCTLYLVGGSAVTKLGGTRKEALGIAEGRGGARGPENVWGSAATAALCALGAALAPARAPLLRIGFVASLATKLADTCASEVGKAYGKRTYLITTLRPVPAGTEGAVSLEGTLAGVGGSVVLASAGVCLHLCAPRLLAPMVAAAFVANNVESLIGAAAQDDYAWLTNELVNFVNTLVGALVAMGAATLLGMA